MKISSFIWKKLLLAFLCLVLVAGTGCRSIGPGTVQRDRMHYSTAVADSWKEQLLLNIVKTRYGDAPAFMEFVLGLTLQAFEGHHNADTLGGQFRPADPQFLKQIQLVGALQRAKAIETEVIKLGNQTEIWLRFHSPESPTTEPAEQIGQLKALLGIPTELDRVKIVFGVWAPEPGAIGMRTRSLMQMLRILGAGVQIQKEHLGDGSASPAEPPQLPGGFTVHCGKEKPKGAFVSVPYEGAWFWIDRRDLVSKTTLSAVTILFNFLEVDSKASPVLTIPAN